MSNEKIADPALLDVLFNEIPRYDLPLKDLVSLQTCCLCFFNNPKIKQKKEKTFSLDKDLKELVLKGCYSIKLAEDIYNFRRLSFDEKETKIQMILCGNALDTQEIKVYFNSLVRNSKNSQHFKELTEKAFNCCYQIYKENPFLLDSIRNYLMDYKDRDSTLVSTTFNLFKRAELLELAREGIITAPQLIGFIHLSNPANRAPFSFEHPPISDSAWAMVRFDFLFSREIRDNIEAIKKGLIKMGDIIELSYRNLQKIFNELPNEISSNNRLLNNGF